MILSAEHVRLIRAGKKTQHRIPIRQQRDVTRKNGTTYRSQPFRPHIGMRVPVSVTQQVDGKPQAIPQRTIIVETYETLFLADGLDIIVARAEGHKTTDAFKTNWVRRHDRPWIDAQTQRLEIEPGDDVLLERFARRHADTAVWAVVFRLDPVVSPRYLAASPTSIEADYTTQPELAARGEGAAVDEVTQRRMSDQGREYDALRKAGAAEQDLDALRSLDATIVQLKTMGVRNGVNLRDQVRMQEKIRAGVERKIRDQVARRLTAA